MVQNMVPRKVPAWFRKGSVCQGQLPKLTEQERTVYDLWATEYQTPLQIACRLKISDSMVRRHIRTIKQKGYVLNMVPGVPKNDPYTERSAQPRDGSIRLHGQHFIVVILHQTPAYESIRSRNNVQHLEGVTIKLHGQKLEIMASNELSFFGSNAEKAYAESMPFWSRLFHKLESQLGIVILKPRAQNIREVASHYERVNCGVAQKVLDEGRTVRLYAREDGKLWFTMDKSLSLKNSETLHPETSQRDMADIIEPVFNDWRDLREKLWTPAQLQQSIQLLVQGQTLLMHQQAELLKSQVPKEQKIGQHGSRIKVVRPDYVG